MVDILEEVENKIINDRIFKAIFINNENVLAKLISDITDIDYNRLKNNITIKINEIPIIHKGEKFKRTDFIVNFGNTTTINIEANSSYYKGSRSKNLSYVFMLYGTDTKKGNYYDDDKLFIQINLNAFKNKNNDNSLVDYMLRDKYGKTYIDNLKIFNLDIVKCYKMYYNCSNLKDLSNSTKWGAFLWSNYEDDCVCDILNDILDNKEVEELESRLEAINMNADGIMSKKEAREWGEWIKNSSLRYYKELAEEEVRKEVTNKVEENNIKNMLENNMDYDLISKITKKSVKEIKEIEKSIK